MGARGLGAVRSTDEIMMHVETTGAATGQARFGADVKAGQQMAALIKPTQVPSHLHLEIQRQDKSLVCCARAASGPGQLRQLLHSAAS